MAQKAEWAIWFAHTILGRGEEGELWSFKTPLFGDVSITGFQRDFAEFEERVAIDVVDIDAPAEQQAMTRAAAIIRRAVLARFGYQYVVIESASAEENPVAMLQDALIGIDHSRLARARRPDVSTRNRRWTISGSRSPPTARRWPTGR